MPRDPRAYLSDIVDSCDAISLAVRGLDIEECTSLIHPLTRNGKGV